MITMNKSYPRLLNQFLTILVLLSLIVSTAPAQGQEKAFIFGIVPQFEAKKMRTIWQPIINYLKKETGYNFTIKGSPTISDFEIEYMQGDFDFAYMNPLHIVLAHESQGYIPLVRDVGDTLHGVLVVKKDSGITDVSQLNGKTIAFPAPNALGASLQMRQELHDFFKLKIFPSYVKTHDSVYLNVLLGEAAAGGGVQKTLSRQQPEYKAALKVIHKTKDVNPHPIVAHPMVPDKVVKAVKAALLKLGETSEGKMLLEKIPMKKIGPATMPDYLPLKELRLKQFYAQ